MPKNRKVLKKTDLTAQQKAFIREYIKDNNGTQAAIRAGYSKKTARQQATRLLAHVHIRAEIDKLLEKCQSEAILTKQQALAILTKQAKGDLTDLMNEHGRLDKEKLISAKGMLKEYIETIVEMPPDSEGRTRNRIIRKVKLSDSRAAIETMAKLLGWNEPEEVDLKGDSLMEFFRSLNGVANRLEEAAEPQEKGKRK